MKKLKVHILQWGKGDSPDMIPKKCKCGSLITLVCNELFEMLVKPCTRKCCATLAKKK